MRGFIDTHNNANWVCRPNQEDQKNKKYNRKSEKMTKDWKCKKQMIWKNNHNCFEPNIQQNLKLSFLKCYCKYFLEGICVYLEVTEHVCGKFKTD